MKPLKKCPECERDLEPATLNPEHRWCPVCATEYDKENQPIVRPGTEKKPVPTSFPGAVKVGAAPAPKTESETEAAADPRQPGPSAPIVCTGGRFRVTIGNVSFDMQSRVDLDIAGTKVQIVAL